MSDSSPDDPPEEGGGDKLQGESGSVKPSMSAADNPVSCLSKARLASCDPPLAAARPAWWVVLGPAAAATAGPSPRCVVAGVAHPQRGAGPTDGPGGAAWAAEPKVGSAAVSVRVSVAGLLLVGCTCCCCSC
eukprot:scaffold82654_cov20-Tisochrysis_lutea.AAC.3